jgi:asparagine synthase (glutamine-hydrolysing)
VSAICGVIGWDSRPWQIRDLAAVIEEITPLGTDGGGAWSGWAGRCGVAVASRIRDHHPGQRAERQPACSDDGSVVVVADVRLDNRGELDVALGIPHSWPDSRLVLTAYQRWGPACLNRLVGVYALAVVDASRGGVLLVRDHLGSRPLVIHERPGLTAFASNALALTALEGVGHLVDEQRAVEVLSLTYASDRTFVAGVRWVPPGHAVWVNTKGPRWWRWWEPDPGRISDLGSPRAHAVAMRATFDEVVRAQIRAGEVVGAELSGGLDSTAVAATAARVLSPRSVLTYTAVPPPGWRGPTRRGWDADESALVGDLILRHPNLRPTFVDTRGSALIEGRYERYWELGGGPPRNPCNFTWTDAIYRSAAEDGVTTLLTGALGNQAFSADGPDWLWDLLRAGRLGQLVAETAHWSQARGVGWPQTLRRHLLPGLTPITLVRLRRRLGLATDPVTAWLAGTAVRRECVNVAGLVAARPQLDPRIPLPHRLALWSAVGDAGGQADTAAALDAHWRIDRRDPTGDRRLFELALTQPEWARRHDGLTRAVAREAMADRLPPSIVWRTRRGEQLPDWLERMTDARAEIATEVTAARDHPLSSRLIDVERLSRLVDAWPEPGRGAEPAVIRDYRFTLLRALVVSRYLRWFEERAAARSSDRRYGAPGGRPRPAAPG